MAHAKFEKFPKSSVSIPEVFNKRSLFLHKRSPCSPNVLWFFARSSHSWISPNSHQPNEIPFFQSWTTLILQAHHVHFFNQRTVDDNFFVIAAKSSPIFLSRNTSQLPQLIAVLLYPCPDIAAGSCSVSATGLYLSLYLSTIPHHVMWATNPRSWWVYIFVYYCLTRYT